MLLPMSRRLARVPAKDFRADVSLSVCLRLCVVPPAREFLVQSSCVGTAGHGARAGVPYSRQLLVALFGGAIGGPANLQCDGIFGQDCRICAKPFGEDMQVSLAQDELESCRGESGLRYGLVLQDACWRECFMELDTRLLRASWPVEYAPLGFEDERDEEDEEEKYVELRGLVCVSLTAEGGVCGTRWQSVMSLITHQQQVEGGRHGARSRVARWTRTNQCLCWRLRGEDDCSASHARGGQSGSWVVDAARFV